MARLFFDRIIKQENFEDTSSWLVHNSIVLQMASLNDISAILEDSPYIFCIYCTSEVRVATVLLSVSTRGLLRNLQEIVSYEVFGSSEFFISSLVDFRLGFR